MLGPSCLKTKVFPASCFHSWHKRYPGRSRCLETKLIFLSPTQWFNILFGVSTHRAKDQNIYHIRDDNKTINKNSQSNNFLSRGKIKENNCAVPYNFKIPSPCIWELPEWYQYSVKSDFKFGLFRFICEICRTTRLPKENLSYFPYNLQLA